MLEEQCQNIPLWRLLACLKVIRCQSYSPIVWVEGWVTSLEHLPLKLCAYIDDRTILTRDRDALANAWSLTHQWDKAVHWKMNVSKSALAIVGPLTKLSLEHEGEVLPISRTLKVLGVEAITQRQKRGGPQAKRTRVAAATCLRIAMLSLGFKASRHLLQVAALPKWRYSIQMKPVPQSQVAVMKKGVKLALRLSGKLHSWWMVAGILNKPHRLDPLSYSMYVHVRDYLRALRSSPDLQELLIQSMQWEQRRSVRGPIRCLQHYASECNIQVEGLMHRFRDRTVHLLNDTPSRILQMWQEALQERMRLGARRSRRVFEGLENADLSISIASAIAKISPWRQELVGLLSDAIWTGHRKKVAGLVESDTCTHCDQGLPEDIFHVLHICPRWQPLRHPCAEYAETIRNAPACLQ